MLFKILISVMSSSILTKNKKPLALVLVLLLTSCVTEPREPEGSFPELEKQSQPALSFSLAVT